MLLSKKKNHGHGQGGGKEGNRFLITIAVLGSAGPIRFVVKEEDVVATVMDTALKSYARQGRLPILGSDLNHFLLYCPSAGRTEALSPWETIGSIGSRNFMLCKKPQMANSSLAPRRKSAGNWKAWFNKSLYLKISSH